MEKKDKVSAGHKILVCGLAGLLMASAAAVMADKYATGFLTKSFLYPLALLLLAAALGYIFIWHSRERKQPGNSAGTLVFWQEVQVWCIAMILFRFAWLKLLHMHMNTSLVYDDMPAGSLSGYALMDYFFGSAPGFKLLIAGLECLGAAGLLFRKTRLAAVFLLLPVMLNIVLMDLFYQVGSGITLVAGIMTAGLFYLLGLHADQLILAFFPAGQSTKALRPWLKQLIRFSAAALPFCLLISVYSPAKNRKIMGKYQVVAAEPNGAGKQDSVPSDIYFDENDDCIFRYDRDYRKIKVGKACFDEKHHRLQVIWRYPLNAVDTLDAVLYKAADQKELLLDGKMGSCPLRLSLQSTALPSGSIR